MLLRTSILSQVFVLISIFVKHFWGTFWHWNRQLASYNKRDTYYLYQKTFFSIQQGLQKPILEIVWPMPSSIWHMKSKPVRILLTSKKKYLKLTILKHLKVSHCCQSMKKRLKSSRITVNKSNEKVINKTNSMVKIARYHRVWFIEFLNEKKTNKQLNKQTKLILIYWKKSWNFRILL